MAKAFDRQSSGRPAASARATDPDWGDDAWQLPLEAEIERSTHGWVIRLPVRAEEVTVEKQSVAVERVAIRTRQVEEVVEVDETVRREQLQVETDEDVDVDSTRRVEADQFREQSRAQYRGPGRESAEKRPSAAAREDAGSPWARPRPPAFRRPGQSDRLR